MLELKLVEPNNFIKIVDLLKDLVKEVTFIFNENGLTLKTLDNSHVAFIKVELRPSFFDHYRSDGELELSLNLPNLNKVLSTAMSGDSLTITAENKPSALKLIFVNDNSAQASKTIRVNLINRQDDEFEMKPLEHSSVIKMNPSLFLSTVKKLGAIADNLTINTANEKVSFAACSDINDAVFEFANTEGISPEEPEFITVECVQSELSVQLQSRFLERFSRSAAVSSELEIKLHESNPSCFTFKVKASEDEEGKPKGEIVFMLAPVIKMEDA